MNIVKYQIQYFEPIKLKVNGNYFINTRAWTFTQSIEQFVAASVNKEMNKQIWKLYTKQKNPFTKLCEYFTTNNDIELPQLVVKRATFSFQNGIL